MSNEDRKRDLALFLENDYETHQRVMKEVVPEIYNRTVNRNYDVDEAIEAYHGIVNDGADRYCSQFGGHFDLEDKAEVAAELEEFYSDCMDDFE